MISMHPGSYLGQRIHETGDEVKLKALLIMSVLCMSRQ